MRAAAAARLLPLLLWPCCWPPPILSTGGVPKRASSCLQYISADQAAIASDRLSTRQPSSHTIASSLSMPSGKASSVRQSVRFSCRSLLSLCVGAAMGVSKLRVLNAPGQQRCWFQAILQTGTV
jgi:hypothetical protein